MGGERVTVVDDSWMIIDLNETKICTLEQLRAILDGTETLEFASAEDSRAGCEWIDSVLNQVLL